MRPSASVEAFDDLVLNEKKPVLLGCFHWVTDIEEQERLLESVSQEYGEELKTYLMHEDSMGAFKESLGIEGTPTFIIFEKGKEKNRFLGVADLLRLTDFIAETLPGFREVHGEMSRSTAEMRSEAGKSTGVAI
jgi:thioredoxin-like negative regulator of GroEL